MQKEWIMVKEKIKVVGDAIKIFGAQNKKKAVIYQQAC